jgi:nucleotide-binding universal stress UspA family protein
VRLIVKDTLVATDFGEASAAALAYGRDLARSYGARLHVLNVVDDIMVRFAANSPSATA